MYIAMSHDPCLSGPFRSGIFDDAPSLFTQPATRASRPVFFSWLANGSCPYMILFNTFQVCRFEMKHEQIECLGVDPSCFVGFTI